MFIDEKWLFNQNENVCGQVLFLFKFFILFEQKNANNYEFSVFAHFSTRKKGGRKRKMWKKPKYWQPNIFQGLFSQKTQNVV